MKPFVGLPSTAVGRQCAYAPDLDQQACGAEAIVHLMVRSDPWGVVGLLTCPDHETIGRATGEVLDEHPVGDYCQYLTGECWND